MIVSDECAESGLVRNEAHVARLALCESQRERVEYACEVLVSSGSLASGAVLDFIELYGYLPNRERQKRNVYTLVTGWRKARGLGDTGGPIPTMTPEMLTILDERAANTEAAALRPSLELVRLNTNTNTDIGNEHADTPAADVREHAPASADIVNTGTSIGVVPVPAPAESASIPPPTPVGSVPTPVEVEVAAADVRVSAGSEVETRSRRRRGTWAASVVAAAATGLSAEGNLRWFSEDLGVSAPFVYAVFAVMELALLACARMMFEHVRDYGRPGPMRVVSWAICGVSAFAAVEVFGPYDGLLRAVVGPVGALVFLHAALGIEIRAGKGRVTVWSRLVEEYRERFLSVAGLGNEHRTAFQRTRERAARRAARLTLASGWTTPFRGARLARALDKSGVDIDPEMWRRTRSALAVRQHRDALKTLDLPSPWITK